MVNCLVRYCMIDENIYTKDSKKKLKNKGTLLKFASGVNLIDLDPEIKTGMSLDSYFQISNESFSQFDETVNKLFNERDSFSISLSGVLNPDLGNFHDSYSFFKLKRNITEDTEVFTKSYIEAIVRENEFSIIEECKSEDDSSVLTRNITEGLYPDLSFFNLTFNFSLNSVSIYLNSKKVSTNYQLLGSTSKFSDFIFDYLSYNISNPIIISEIKIYDSILTDYEISREFKTRKEVCLSVNKSSNNVDIISNKNSSGFLIKTSDFQFNKNNGNSIFRTLSDCYSSIFTLGNYFSINCWFKGYGSIFSIKEINPETKEIIEESGIDVISTSNEIIVGNSEFHQTFYVKDNTGWNFCTLNFDRTGNCFEFFINGEDKSAAYCLSNYSNLKIKFYDHSEDDTWISNLDIYQRNLSFNEINDLMSKSFEIYKDGFVCGKMFNEADEIKIQSNIENFIEIEEFGDNWAEANNVSITNGVLICKEFSESL